MRVYQGYGSSDDYWRAVPDDREDWLVRELEHMRDSKFSSPGAKAFAMARLSTRPTTKETASSPTPQS